VCESQAAAVCFLTLSYSIGVSIRGALWRRVRFEDLEVLEQSGAELDPGLPFLTVEELGLGPGPERLDHGVIEGIADGAHRRHEPARRTRSLNARGRKSRPVNRQHLRGARHRYLAKPSHGLEPLAPSLTIVGPGGKRDQGRVLAVTKALHTGGDQATETWPTSARERGRTNGAPRDRFGVDVTAVARLDQSRYSGTAASRLVRFLRSSLP
jgi:hypothetical protein